MEGFNHRHIAIKLLIVGAILVLVRSLYCMGYMGCYRRDFSNQSNLVIHHANM